jgi:hypothetical protein
MLLTVVAGLAIPAALGRTHGQTTRAACGIKQFDVYFWPHGHPEVPALGFPAYAPPHLEIYLRGSVANAAQRGYVDASTAGFAKSCATKIDDSARWAGGPTARRVAAARVRCRFPWTVDFQTFPGQPTPSQQLFVTRGESAKSYLYVSIGQSGSYATFDKRYCAATPIAGIP